MLIPSKMVVKGASAGSRIDIAGVLFLQVTVTIRERTASVEHWGRNDPSHMP